MPKELQGKRENTSAKESSRHLVDLNFAVWGLGSRAERNKKEMSILCLRSSMVN